MRYSLVLLKGENNGRNIFKKIPAFADIGDNEVDSIISFINIFASEVEFKTFLTNAGLILANDWHDTIALYQCDGINDGFIREITYRENPKAYSIEYIKDYYLRNLSDKYFLQTVLERFYKSEIQDERYRKLIKALNSIFIFLKKYNKLPTSSHTIMEEFIDYYCHQLINNEKVLNYAHIREMANLALQCESKHAGPQKFLASRKNTQYEQEYISKTPYNKDEIAHLTYLLSDNPTDEEREIYADRIKKLERAKKDEAMLSNIRPRNLKSKNKGRRDYYD